MIHQSSMTPRSPSSGKWIDMKVGFAPSRASGQMDTFNNEAQEKIYIYIYDFIVL